MIFFTFHNVLSLSSAICLHLKCFGIVVVVGCSSTFEHKWRKTCQNVLALLKLLMSISEAVEDETSN